MGINECVAGATGCTWPSRRHTLTLVGAEDERLSIRHDAGSGAGPYRQGTLPAIRKVRDDVGLVRGLDRLMN
jgi:hypothetical protein